MYYLIYTRTCVYIYEGGEEGIFSANRFNWDELILNNKARKVCIY